MDPDATRRSNKALHQRITTRDRRPQAASASDLGRSVSRLEYIKLGLESEPCLVYGADPRSQIRHRILIDEINSTATETSTRHSCSINAVDRARCFDKKIQFRTADFIVVAKRLMRCDHQFSGGDDVAFAKSLGGVEC